MAGAAQNEMPAQYKESQKVPNRVFILIAGAICGLGCGAIYMWSIFNKPLMTAFGFSTSDVSLVYSLFMLATCISSFIAGWLQQKVQARFIIFGAGILFGLGWFLSGFANSLLLLYLFYGVFAGAGNGFLYNTIVSVVTKWFPDKLGLANGVCIGTMGLGPVIFAPFGNYLIETMDVQMAFHVVGIVWLVVYVSLSLFLRTPPDGWAPNGSERHRTATGKEEHRESTPGPTPSEKVSHESTSASTSSHRKASSKASIIEPVSLTGKQMVKTPLFYVLFLIFTTGCISGQMITGHASNIGQDFASLSAAEGAIMVSALAVGSVCGRVGLGFLSDVIGRFNTLGLIMIMNTIVMLFIINQAHTFVAFLIAICIVGAGFGGTVTVMPTLVAESFGPKHFGTNYSLVYPGYTVSALFGPTLAAYAFDLTQGYESALMIAGLLSAIGIVLVFVGKRISLPKA